MVKKFILLTVSPSSDHYRKLHSVMNWFWHAALSSVNILYDNKVNSSAANLTVQRHSRGNEQKLFNKLIY